jgi:hypothetical protein
MPVSNQSVSKVHRASETRSLSCRRGTSEHGNIRENTLLEVIPSNTTDEDTAEWKDLESAVVTIIMKVSVIICS